AGVYAAETASRAARYWAPRGAGPRLLFSRGDRDTDPMEVSSWPVDVQGSPTHECSRPLGPWPGGRATKRPLRWPGAARPPWRGTCATNLSRCCENDDDELGPSRSLSARRSGWASNGARATPPWRGPRTPSRHHRPRDRPQRGAGRL